MVIEDIYEGVGCLSQNAVAISEFGMCFADSNNVYLHDGNTPIQIANNIDGNMYMLCIEYIV